MNLFLIPISCKSKRIAAQLVVTGGPLLEGGEKSQGSGGRSFRLDQQNVYCFQFVFLDVADVIYEKASSILQPGLVGICFDSGRLQTVRQAIRIGLPSSNARAKART